MAMTLAQARVRLSRMLDDVDVESYDADEIDDGLKIGQKEAWDVAVSTGSTALKVTGSFTSTSGGVVDLSSVKPKRLVAVWEWSQDTRTLVLPARLDDLPAHHAVSETLLISYVPSVFFPEDDVDSFIWGHASVETEQLDELMLLSAYAALKPKEGEKDYFAERRLQVVQNVTNMPSPHAWTSITLADWGHPSTADFAWLMTAPHTLQLVT